jgi:hypothetical protein
VATHHGSLLIAYRLSLLRDWDGDPLPRAIAGVPADVVFQTKPEIALQQLRKAAADWRAARRGAEGPPPMATTANCLLRSVTLG